MTLDALVLDGFIIVTVLDVCWICKIDTGSYREI